MRRRQFLGVLGAAATWPVAALAQQRERMRRIGVLMSLAADDPEAPAQVGAFHRGWLNWVGVSVATCASSIVGMQAILTQLANTQRS